MLHRSFNIMLPAFGLALIFGLIIQGSALDINGRIIWNEACPNYKALGPSKVILDHGRLTGGVLTDGSFKISDVSSGTYILSVLSHDHSFDQLRIDVSEAQSEPTLEVRPYTPGTPLNPPSSIVLSHPIKLQAKQKYDYFVPPESFNIMGMLGNPMMLIMIFGGAMVLGMPYIMKNLDPEALEEFKEQQAKMTKMQDAMKSGDLKSGWSALTAGLDEAPPQATPQSRTQPANKGRGKNRKR